MGYEDVIATVNEAIIELNSEVSEFQDKANAMIEYAERKSSNVVNNSESYVPLDDTPFGEELIRTRDIPGRLEQMSKELAEIDEESPCSQLEALQRHETELENLSAEFYDCFQEIDIKQALNETRGEW